MTNDLFILGGARTPMTQHVGALKDVSAIELGAIATKGALARAGVAPDAIDHVVFGNVQQSSTDAHYGARHVGLRAGLPIEVPALTVNRSVRVGHPGGSERRAADPARRGRDGRGRRHGEHEPGAARDPRPAQRPAPRPGQARRLAVGGPQRPLRRLLDGHHRRELRGQVRHHPRAGRPLRAAQPAAGARRLDVGDHGRGDRAGRGQGPQGRHDHRPRRSPAAGDDARRTRRPADGVQEGRRRHRRQRQRHRRRGGGAGDCVGGGGQGSRPDAARPDRVVGGRRRRAHA